MRTARRLGPIGKTIFTEITRMAAERGAINLGQGFPNFDGPEFVKEAATRAMADGHNQYPPSFGIPELARAVADRFTADTGLAIDPAAHVTITSGCTEALAATFLGLIDPGDEVVLIEPTYDAYPADLALAGGVGRYVTLRPPSFALDIAELRDAFTPRTRAIVVNTPHNPTGRVFTSRELQAVADLCREHDAIAISDEVYERMVYEGEHLSLAAFPGMWERTVTLSSLGKSFSLTGWKVGWAIAPEQLTAGVRGAHQFLTFATAHPLQHGAVAALSVLDDYYRELVDAYRRRRDLLAEGLEALGFGVFVPHGTYFLMADHTPFGFADDAAFVRHLIQATGVAAIPPSAFYHRTEDGASLVRFAFCKDEGTLREALLRMEPLRAR
ncbi:MAG: aminotransferase class I/II-fold pyridoxal phosphate-dependent enzyme [Acidimicrobiia bacterium]